MKKIVILVVVLVILLGGVAVAYKVAKKAVNHVTSSQEKMEGTTMTPSMAQAMTPSATGGAMTTKEITVTGSNFAFDPKTINVKVGDHVKITFTSAGGLHDFNIDAFNVHSQKISAGKSDTVEFTADKAGTYEYYCSVGNHRAMGMVGTLTVQ